MYVRDIFDKRKVLGPSTTFNTSGEATRHFMLIAENKRTISNSHLFRFCFVG